LNEEERENLQFNPYPFAMDANSDSTSVESVSGWNIDDPAQFPDHIKSLIWPPTVEGRTEIGIEPTLQTQPDENFQEPLLVNKPDNSDNMDENVNDSMSNTDSGNMSDPSIQSIGHSTDSLLSSSLDSEQSTDDDNLDDENLDDENLEG